MEKVEIQIPLSDEARRYKEKVYQILINDPHVKTWLKEHQLPTSFVYEHTGKFTDWLTGKQRCDQCMGLSYCRQGIKGKYMDLYMDKFLDFTMRSCSYYCEYVKSLAHEKYYVESKLSAEQLQIDLATLDIRKESNSYKANVAHVIALLQDETNTKGLYLWGKPGAGKSYLALGVTNFFAKRNVHVAFVNVAKLISDLKMMFYDHEAMEAKLRNITNVEVLVLDDIGAESITAWSRDEILLPLLDARMERCKLTLFTSNYNLMELKERYVMTNNHSSEPMAAERVMERITTLAKDEFVKGESRRK